jgi:hypothetical protein
VSKWFFWLDDLFFGLSTLCTSSMNGSSTTCSLSHFVSISYTYIKIIFWFAVKKKESYFVLVWNKIRFYSLLLKILFPPFSLHLLWSIHKLSISLHLLSITTAHRLELFPHERKIFFPMNQSPHHISRLMKMTTIFQVIKINRFWWYSVILIKDNT